VSKMDARNEKCSPPGTDVHMGSKMSPKNRKEGVVTTAATWFVFIITAFEMTTARARCPFGRRLVPDQSPISHHPAHARGDLFDEDFSDTSSISESSIIDLPPPLSPSRIVPPPSLSVNRGLDILAGIEQSPVIGAVVRRTRSARFLARSWGSRNEDEENQEGYGTFGYAQGGRAGDHQL